LLPRAALVAQCSRAGERAQAGRDSPAPWQGRRPPLSLCRSWIQRGRVHPRV